MRDTDSPTPPQLSVIVPVFNEEEVLPEFHRRLGAVLDALGMSAEILYVNDGSRDGSRDCLLALKNRDARVAVLDLSRNFGKEIAMSAGLDHALGTEGVIIMDADLQDPPELIPQLLEVWRQGVDVVYAQREEREGESLTKKFTAYWFYRVMQAMSEVKIPADTGDFRFLSRRAVNALNRLRERHRFMKGLFAWIGYPQQALRYRRASRQAGKTKWNYWRLWNFALEGITSFSVIPLKFSSYLGLLIAGAAFVYGLIIIVKTLLFGEPVKGYPSLMTVILFLGGVQLMVLGIIGEYLGRMFTETKQRPLYLVNHYLPATRSPEHDSGSEQP